jgi:sulfate adenylyltransferase subunit 2
MYALRDRMVAETGWSCSSIATPRPRRWASTPSTTARQIHTDLWKTQGLKQALDKYGFDAAFGGARRDEEKSRAKERIFSFRSAQHRWDPKNQRPELWHLYNARKHPASRSASSRSRTGPSSTSGSTSGSRTSRSCRCTSPPRPVVERDGTLIMVDDERMPLRPARCR